MSSDAFVAGQERRDGICSYLEYFAPTFDWDELVRWPPDVFALCNLVLDHTKSYRYVVAPPTDRHWPPLPAWNEQVEAAAKAWRDACDEGGELPPLIRESWQTVSDLRDLWLTEIRTGEAWELISALLTLHAAADEACAGIARGATAPSGSFEQRAWSLLEEQGSLCRLSPRRMRIVPKTNFSPRGVTIRSLSRYLGLCYETIPVSWRSGGRFDPPGDYNVVLLPWPLEVKACDFRAAPSPPRLQNMDTRRFGFFEFAPQRALDTELVGALLAEAVAETGSVDALLLPELAVLPTDIPALERTLDEHGVFFLVAGVREHPAGAAHARNYLHFGVRRGSGWERAEQDKHHRWCMDEGQIRQYHLARTLDPSKLWWEAIGLGERRLNVVDVGSGLTAAPLVCEDLASLDEVAELVRTIGPGLVVALLLDGPPLSMRWPCRYAGVLADDPGAAVLTLTSYGMVERCRPPGKPRSRVVAHWNSRAGGAQELRLAPRAAGLLVSLRVARTTNWTADGRQHNGVPSLQLSGVRQLGQEPATGATTAEREAA